MNTVLKQFSLIIAGVMFFVSLVLGILAQDGVTIEVLFRAIMVFFISAITIGIFFRFFAGVLYNFVLDKMEETRAEAEELEKEGEATSGEAPGATPKGEGK